MNNFEINISDIVYKIKFEKELTRFKPLEISISREQNSKIYFLETKKYNKVRRRIYNNLVNITKLSDGLIKKYSIHNELELELLAKYLSDNNVLFRIQQETTSFKRLFKPNDKSYKFVFKSNENYPDRNYVFSHLKVYIIVYKGFVEITNENYKETLEKKFKIYLL